MSARTPTQTLAKACFALLLICVLLISIAPSAQAALVVNKYTNTFTLSSENNEQLKACACEQKVDVLTLENTGNFYETYNLAIISPKVDWMELSTTSIELGPGQQTQFTNTVSAPCGERGTYDYAIKATSSYGRVQYLERSYRQDQCQNVVLHVTPSTSHANICSQTTYEVTVRNPGRFSETYDLSFGTFSEQMSIPVPSIYLRAGESHTQTATFTPECKFYGDIEIPFIASSERNNIVQKESVPLSITNQYDHKIGVSTSAQFCEQVNGTTPITITNLIDVPTTYNVAVRGPNFVNLYVEQQEISLAGNETYTIDLPVQPQAGRAGSYPVDITVTSNIGDITKKRTLALDVDECYASEVEVRALDNTPIMEDTRCCGLAEYFVHIVNTGMFEETFNIDAHAPSWFRPEELTVRLQPGEARNVRILSDTPCSDEEYVIPVTITNNRFKHITATTTFTINSQSAQACYAVEINDDELLVTPRTQSISVPVQHTGSEGGVYDVALESDLFSVQETQITLAAGETISITLLVNDLTNNTFGRYISQPSFTYSKAQNPDAIETRTYNEHIGTQYTDVSLLQKLATRLDTIQWNALGWCGWLSIGLLILLILCIILLIRVMQGTISSTVPGWVSIVLLVGVFVIFIALALVQLPDPAGLIVSVEHDHEHFITIPQEETKTLDLDEYFIDPDADELDYVVTQGAHIAARVQDNILTLTPDQGFFGDDMITMTARDNNGGIIDSPELIINVQEREKLSALELFHRYCAQSNLGLLLLIVLTLLLVSVILAPVNNAETKRSKDEKRTNMLEDVLPPVKPRATAKKPAAQTTRAKKSSVKKVVKKSTKSSKLSTTKKTPKKTAQKTVGVTKTISSKKPTEQTARGASLDRALVSSEEHEMRHVLDVHGKRGTQRNVELLQFALRDFKKDRRGYKPKNRAQFYRYIREQNVLRILRNK